MSAANSNGFTLRSSGLATDVVGPNDDIVIYTSASAQAVTIPDARTLQRGKVYSFSNQAAGLVTLTPAAGTIDGQSSQTVAAFSAPNPGTRRIVSDGTNWFSV